MGGFELTPPWPGRTPKDRLLARTVESQRVNSCTDLWEQMGIDWGAVPRIPWCGNSQAFGDFF